jgi:MerR family redox-sensitive transcriptional activator SoxR
LKLTSSQGHPSGLITIGQLSLESGLPASTIRYWERVGVLPKPLRVSGQRRYARLEGLQRLAVLRLAQLCGFRLEEMRELVHGFEVDASPSRRWQDLARQKQAEIDQQIARLEAMRRVVKRVMKCKCLNWVECGRIATAVVTEGR